MRIDATKANARRKFGQEVCSGQNAYGTSLVSHWLLFVINTLTIEVVKIQAWRSAFKLYPTQKPFNPLLEA